VLTYLLLQDRSDMGVGGVGRQGEDRSGKGVRQGNCGDEGRFGCGVQATGVAAGVRRPILLGDQVQQGCPR
jgi:hypothetical protein